MAFSRSRGAKILVVGVVVLLLGGFAGALGFYVAFVRDLPDLRSIDDYQPPLASHVVDRNGIPIGEYFVERRRLVPYDAIPKHVIRAFVAGEDSSFFEHSGIDYSSILRAAWVNLRAGGEIRQGGSTITQQMVKGLLLSPERKLRRKIREMILARDIEQRFSKDEILYLYLTQIYFGHGAYGIGEAAHRYFGKSVSALTVSEGALLAGLPQAPSRYSPYAAPELAEARRRYVLERMHNEGFIDSPTYQDALANAPELMPTGADENFEVAASFTEEVRRYLFDTLGGDSVLKGGLMIETSIDVTLQGAALAALRQGLDDLDRRQGYRGPLRRVGADEIPAVLLDLARENGLLPDEAVAELALEADSDVEAEYAENEERIAPPTVDGEPHEPHEPHEPTTRLAMDREFMGVVLAVEPGEKRARIGFAPEVEALVRLEDVGWAREFSPDKAPSKVTDISKVFAVGDVANFSVLAQGDDAPTPEEADDAPVETFVSLQQRPIVEGALLSLDVASGDVLAMVGGYDFSRSQFNRVTQAHRQPGSAFKPLIYAAALAGGKYTPASILYDRPVVYVDETSGFTWRPQNYGRAFYGPITMRQALTRSVNNATVHLFRDVGVANVIDYVRKLGIVSPLNRDLSLALGSSGVTLAELTTTYAVFPAGGRRVVPRFIRRVTDRNGAVLLENVALGAQPEGDEGPDDELDDGLTSQSFDVAASPKDNGDQATGDDAVVDPDQLIPPEEAYLVTDLLRAVVVDPKGTGWRLRALRRPVAGKTGTTNDQADAWFMGFSPDITTGVWVGHDESRFLGWGETGSRAAAPIWVDYMSVALANRPVREFQVPDPIVFARIDRVTGLLADSTNPDTVFQAFASGTVPTESASSARTSSEGRRLLRLDPF